MKRQFYANLSTSNLTFSTFLYIILHIIKYLKGYISWKKKENILVFDSGIGGVTVLKEIIKILPNENYIYYSDSKNNPYGDKTNKEIIKINNFVRT